MSRVSPVLLVVLISACSDQDGAVSSPRITQTSAATARVDPPAREATDTTPARAPDEPMVVGGDVTAPIIVKRVEPQWPEQMTGAGLWLFSMVVTKNGQVKDLQLIKGERGEYSKLVEEA